MGVLYLAEQPIVHTFGQTTKAYILCSQQVGGDVYFYHFKACQLVFVQIREQFAFRFVSLCALSGYLRVIPVTKFRVFD